MNGAIKEKPPSWKRKRKKLTPHHEGKQLRCFGDLPHSSTTPPSVVVSNDVKDKKRIDQAWDSLSSLEKWVVSSLAESLTTSSRSFLSFRSYLSLYSTSSALSIYSTSSFLSIGCVSESFKICL